MHHDADPADVALAGGHEVDMAAPGESLRTDASAAEVGPYEPARLADILDQGRKCAAVLVYLEAALDSASKLWGELTVDDRRTAVLRVHAAESIVGQRLKCNPRGSA